MGTHPIFESEFDCLTEVNESSPPGVTRHHHAPEQAFWRWQQFHATANRLSLASILGSLCLFGLGRLVHLYLGAIDLHVVPSQRASLVRAARHSDHLSRCYHALRDKYEWRRTVNGARISI